MSRLAATKLQALPPFPKVISLKYFVRLMSTIINHVDIAWCACGLSA